MDFGWAGIASLFVLVTVWHELGHFCAAKWLGVPVRRIGIGFGPTLWRSPISGETELVLRALPMGMSLGVPGRFDTDGQLRRPIAQDLWMAAGGPIASFLLSAVLVPLAMLLNVDAATTRVLLNVSLLSLVVGVLNLLPVPGLDGGHLVMLLLARAGWQLSPRMEMRINRVCLQVLVVACLLSSIAQAWHWLARA